MAEKKRKVATTTPTVDPPKKRSKKSVTPAETAVPAGTQAEAAVQALGPAQATVDGIQAKARRSTRKRAADFLEDDATSEAVSAPSATTTVPAADVVEKSTKKTKQSESSTKRETKKKGRNGIETVTKSLTADGSNGVVEDPQSADVDITTAGPDTATSLEAEALRTVDREVEDEVAGISDDDEADQGAALLAGFDSDSDDPAEDQNLDLSKTAPIPQFKKTSKKLKQAAEKPNTGPGTVYVGRIPHGFYEQPMRDYFSQFGHIAQLRLSRNKRTGASKHFAFIQFQSEEVAKIVAETMDNYLMFGHILKCKFAPQESLHPDVWKGANRKYRKIPHQKLEKQRLEAPKTQEQWEKKNKKEQVKRNKKAEKLKEIGYEIDMPILKTPSAVLEERKLLEQSQPQPEAITDTTAVPDVVPASPPKDEIALKAPAKDKKKIKSTIVSPLTEGNLESNNITNDDAAKDQESKKKKKSSAVQSTATELDMPEAVIDDAATTKPAVLASDNTTTAEKKEKVKKAKMNGKHKAPPASSAVAPTESTDMGDYNALSSIPVGAEAIQQFEGNPNAMNEYATGYENDLPEAQSGVADRELKQRKKDRKAATASGSKKSKKTSSGLKVKAVKSDESAEAVEEKVVEKEGKKVKGSLKK